MSSLLFSSSLCFILSLTLLRSPFHVIFVYGVSPMCLSVSTRKCQCQQDTQWVWNDAHGRPSHSTWESEGRFSLHRTCKCLKYFHSQIRNLRIMRTINQKVVPQQILYWDMKKLDSISHERRLAKWTKFTEALHTLLKSRIYSQLLGVALTPSFLPRPTEMK